MPRACEITQSGSDLRQLAMCICYHASYEYAIIAHVAATSSYSSYIFMYTSFIKLYNL